METLTQHFDSVYKKAKDYTETSIELLKLNAIDTTADIVSSIVSRMIMLFMVSIFILFVSVTASLYIGEHMGHYYLGFLIVSGFYLILAFLVYFFKDILVKTPITNLVIDKMTKVKKRN
ncbi:hypothetical protein ACFFU9_11715 [Mariniflexile ostreae]|uniref:Superfamily III holin-X n=1 Tax=Mariniflexile ostreae TaxID=1520892 RepID=A0ABV5FD76_9FLAO